MLDNLFDRGADDGFHLNSSLVQSIKNADPSGAEKNLETFLGRKGTEIYQMVSSGDNDPQSSTAVNPMEFTLIIHPIILAIANGNREEYMVREVAAQAALKKANVDHNANTLTCTQTFNKASLLKEYYVQRVCLDDEMIQYYQESRARNQHKRLLFEQLQSETHKAKSMAEHQEGQAAVVDQLLDQNNLWPLWNKGLQGEEWNAIRKGLQDNFFLPDEKYFPLDFCLAFGLNPSATGDEMSLDTDCASSLPGSLMAKMGGMTINGGDDSSTIRTTDGPANLGVSTPVNRYRTSGPNTPMATVNVPTPRLSNAGPGSQTNDDAARTRLFAPIPDATNATEEERDAAAQRGTAAAAAQGHVAGAEDDAKPAAAPNEDAKPAADSKHAATDCTHDHVAQKVRAVAKSESVVAKFIAIAICPSEGTADEREWVDGALALMGFGRELFTNDTVVDYIFNSEFATEFAKGIVAASTCFGSDSVLGVKISTCDAKFVLGRFPQIRKHADSRSGSAGGAGAPGQRGNTSRRGLGDDDDNTVQTGE